MRVTTQATSWRTARRTVRRINNQGWAAARRHWPTAPDYVLQKEHGLSYGQWEGSRRTAVKRLRRLQTREALLVVVHVFSELADLVTQIRHRRLHRLHIVFQVPDILLHCRNHD